MSVSLVERAKQRLRGEYGSIRHRFFVLPRLWLAYGVHRLSGGSWTSFYRKIVDSSAKSTHHQIRTSDRQMVDEARDHLAFLIERGLKPSHRLLDYGCGQMRLGVHAIPYLSEGRYTGGDISPAVLDNGIHLLGQYGIARERFDAVALADCSLKEFAGKRFDFVWANSVVTHMEEPQIETMLRAMRGVLDPGGAFFFTFSETQERRRYNIKDFFHPADVIERLVRSAGFRFALDRGWRSSVAYDRMAVATVA